MASPAKNLRGKTPGPITVAMTVEDELIRLAAATDKAECQRAEDALRQSEAYLAEAQKLSHTGSWALDVACDKYVYVSEECLRIYGFDPQGGLPTREAVFRRIHPEDRERVERTFKKSLREKIDGSDELRFVMPDGTVKEIHVIHHPVLNSAGDVVQLVGTSIDITERKRAEEERRESAERFRAVADYTYDWENWIGLDGKLLWVNPAVERITGYSADECMAMPEFPIPIVAEADRETVAQQMRQAVQGSSRNDFEFRVRHKKGHLAWVAASWQPIYDSRGARLGYRSSMRDIAERKRAEAALQRSEAYLAEAQVLSHTGSWAFDLASYKYIYLSDECFRIFGMDPKDGLPTREAFSQFIHPEDWGRVRAEFDKTLREKVDTSSEFRVVLPSGVTKHLHATRHPILNDAVDLVQIVGTVVDITERKIAEQELRTSEAQLAHERDRLRLLLEINNHIVSKLDADELFQAVSASMRRHFGNDLTSLWLLNETGCFEHKFCDLPTGRGFLAKTQVLPNVVSEDWFRLRLPHIASAEMAGFLPSLLEAWRAESLVSVVLMPLVGADHPLGLLVMGSRKTNAFSEADCDLLSQIGTQISLVLDNALAHGRLRASRDELQDQRLYLESEIRSEYNFEEIVGNSPAIRHVMKQVAIVAPTDSTVLLHGETGTGKELVARAIHRSSPRRERTFVKLNCAAIPSGLLESELFGHEKGAFTGALMQKKGRFELADRGTLFLDEIGDISLELQPKLLRALQEHEFERLGSTKTIQVNVRIIAATHRDIAAMIRNNQFREDLFYRLNVFPIEIPPLRERRGDVSLLVHYFVSRLARRMQKNIKTIPKQAMEALVNAPWPGNVRELENFIERAVILSQGSELNVPLAELNNVIRARRDGKASSFHDAERQAILDALKAASGKLAGAGGAAERLGLKRTTLQNKMRRLQISPSDY